MLPSLLTWKLDGRLSRPPRRATLLWEFDRHRDIRAVVASDSTAAIESPRLRVHAAELDAYFATRLYPGILQAVPPPISVRSAR